MQFAACPVMISSIAYWRCRTQDSIHLSSSLFTNIHHVQMRQTFTSKAEMTAAPEPIAMMVLSAPQLVTEDQINVAGTL
jgi:dipeptide/tripeptide permease